MFDGALADEIGFDNAFVFRYSPRKDTPAATMENQIAPAVMDERLQRLQALLNRQQHEFNIASIGKTCEILIERDGKRHGQKIGKSPWLQSVIVEQGPEAGTLLSVELVSAAPNSLMGVAREKVPA